MIVAENLVYHIQGRRLTDDVSLTLPEGEIIAILARMAPGNQRCYASSRVICNLTVGAVAYSASR